VWMTHSWVEGSYTAVVPISTALLPYPNSAGRRQGRQELVACKTAPPRRLKGC
jgi:hypothetical protein